MTQNRTKLVVPLPPSRAPQAQAQAQQTALQKNSLDNPQIMHDKIHI